MRAPPSRTTDPYARVHGTPGEQPRLQGLLRVLLPLFIGVGVAGYLVRAAFPWPPLERPFVGFLCVLLALFLAIAVNASQTRLRSFLKGARGEEAVGRILALLSTEHDVFHGLPASGNGVEALGDWDHVVIGPTGVFVVETKRWSGAVTIADGRILVGGREPTRPPLEQVQQAANVLRARLRDATGEAVAVQPILCFAGSAGASLQTCGLSGVLICGDRHLLDTIREHHDGPLTAAQRMKIVGVLHPAEA